MSDLMGDDDGVTPTTAATGDPSATDADAPTRRPSSTSWSQPGDPDPVESAIDAVTPLGFAEPDRRRAPVGQRELQEELQKFASEFLIFVTPKGELAAASAFNTLGYDGEERSGHHIAEHIHPDDLPKIFDVIERARRTPGFDETVEARARHKDGSWRLFDARVYDASLRSNLKGSVLRVRDITDEHNQRVATDDAAAERFLSLAEMLPLGILQADARGWVAFCNEAAEQIFNLPGDLLLGHGWENAVLEDDRPEVAHAVGDTLTHGTPNQVTFRIVTGVFQRWAHAKFVPLAGEGGANGFIATIEDITDRRRAESALAHQATHDPLTGLPNRTLLDDRLRQAAGRMRRDATSITLFFVDLDDFKEINDTLGHHAGDQVLTEVALRLRNIMRDVDTVCRLGGDEFVGLCESLPEEEVDGLVARMHDAIRVSLIVDGSPVTVGASIGVSRTTEADVDVADLLAMADQAMYRDKKKQKKQRRKKHSTG
jgi:diguanylate cyclase (GGDEF)-like protein/PAS domain S-box-containing protein